MQHRSTETSAVLTYIALAAPTGRLYANEVLDHAYVHFSLAEEAQKEIDPMFRKQEH